MSTFTVTNEIEFDFDQLSKPQQRKVIEAFINEIEWSASYLTEAQKKEILNSLLTKEQLHKIAENKKGDALLSDFGIKLNSLADEQKFKEIIKNYW